MKRSTTMILALALVLAAVAVFAFTRLLRREQTSDVLLAPGVQLRECTLACVDGVGAFDVLRSGVVLRCAGGRVLGPENEPLAGNETEACSLAVLADDAIFVSFANGCVGIWTGAGFGTIAQLQIERPKLRASADRTCLLAFGRSPGTNEHELWALDLEGATALLAGSPLPITDAATNGATTLFAVGPCVFRVGELDAPEVVLRLPAAGVVVMGLCITESGQVFFSTAETVYVLRGGLAIPLVIGVGGPLRWRESLYVLDMNAKLIHLETTSRNSGASRSSAGYAGGT